MTLAAVAAARASCVDCGTTLATKRATRCVPCFNRYRRGWERDEIIAAVNRFYAQQGWAPMSTDWRKRGDWPTRRQVLVHFERFNDAIRAAGLTPRRSGQWRSFGGGRPPTQARTVANGYTPAQEVEWLTEQQAKDGNVVFAEHRVSIDALSSRFIARHGLWYGDWWTDTVAAVVDRRRDIDIWAEAA